MTASFFSLTSIPFISTVLYYPLRSILDTGDSRWQLTHQQSAPRHHIIILLFLVLSSKAVGRKRIRAQHLVVQN
jgi:hypothetical protein